MKRHPVFLIVLILSLLLTSCRGFRIVKVTSTPEVDEPDLDALIAMALTEQAAKLTPVPTETVAPSPVPTDLPASPMPVEPQPATPPPPPPPSPPEEPGSSGEMNIVEAGNLVISLPSEVAYTIDVTSVPGSVSSDGIPDFWTPPHRLVSFTNYRIQHHFHTPGIYVYPREELIGRGAPHPDALDGLTKLLDDPGRDLRAEKSLPFLPAFNAAQVFHVLEKRIDSDNSNGIRYLTLYSQAYVAITDYELFYTYQGISADGRYYIAAVLPIHSDLLSDQEPSGSELETILANYDMYLAGIIGLLSGDGGASLTPTLADLDAMMKSLTILD